MPDPHYGMDRIIFNPDGTISIKPRTPEELIAINRWHTQKEKEAAAKRDIRYYAAKQGGSI